MLRKVVSAVVIMIVGVAFFNQASADVPVDLKFNNLGSDRKSIREFLLQDESYKRTFDQTGRLAREQRGLYFSLSDVWVGRVDLDGDGINEIIISIGWTGVCGSIGCPVVVLKKVAGQLQSLIEITGTGFVVVDKPLRVQIAGPPNDPGCNYTTAMVTPRTGSFRTFHAYHTGAYWNGKEFRYFCVTRCCE